MLWKISVTLEGVFPVGLFSGHCWILFYPEGLGVQLSTWLRTGPTSRVICACTGTAAVVYGLFMCYSPALSVREAF